MSILYLTRGYKTTCFTLHAQARAVFPAFWKKKEMGASQSFGNNKEMSASQSFGNNKEMGASQSAYDKEAASSRGGGSEASSEASPASGGPASGGGGSSGGQGTEASPAEIILRKDGIIARQKRKSKIDGNRVYFGMY